MDCPFFVDPKADYGGVKIPGFYGVDAVFDLFYLCFLVSRVSCAVVVTDDGYEM